MPKVEEMGSLEQKAALRRNSRQRVAKEENPKDEEGNEVQ